MRTALVALAVVALLAWRPASASQRGRVRRTVRFGGPRTALALRARPGSLVLGRWALRGFVPTPLRLASPRGAVAVVGPTQSGKTTLVCAPLLERWAGPVLAASVKRDLAERTIAVRRRFGRVVLLAPGADGSTCWDPVSSATDWHRARGVARDLTVGTGAGASGAEHEFWSSLAAKLLAPLLLAAHHAGGTIDDVRAWVDLHDADAATAWLAGEPSALTALDASFSRDDRTLGGVLATVEAAIDAFDGRGERFDPAALLDGMGTCYLAAPLHDQRRFGALFAGVVRQVLAAAADTAAAGNPSGLLVLLDEAASIAPLEELDQVAATCQGQGVTLVTVWQDLAQLTARYGDRARTVLNNHAARVLLGGLADPTLAEWLPVLTGTRNPGDQSATSLGPDELRRWPRGAALYVAGRHPPLRLVLGGTGPRGSAAPQYASRGAPRGTPHPAGDGLRRRRRHVAQGVRGRRPR